MTATATRAHRATIPTSRAAWRISRPQFQSCSRKPASRKHISTAHRPAASAPPLYAQAQPEPSTGWCFARSPTRESERSRNRARRAKIDALRASMRRKRDRAHDRARSSHATAIRRSTIRRWQKQSSPTRIEIRRSGAERHLSRHGCQPADRRSSESAVRRCSCYAASSTAIRRTTTCSISTASFRTATANL